MPLKITPIMYLNKEKTVQLSYDELQWILETGRPDQRKPGSDSGFRGRSYIRSNKRILLSCIRDKNLKVDVVGRRRLAVLPETFKSFHTQLEASGEDLLFARLERAARSAAPLPERSVVSKATRIKRIRKWRAGRTSPHTGGFPCSHPQTRTAA